MRQPRPRWPSSRSPDRSPNPHMNRLLLPITILLALLVAGSAQATTLEFGHQGSPDGATSPRAALRKANSALVHGGDVHRSADVTPRLKQLALDLPALTGSAHKQAVGLLSRPTPGE